MYEEEGLCTIQKKEKTTLLQSVHVLIALGEAPRTALSQILTKSSRTEGCDTHLVVREEPGVVQPEKLGAEGLAIVVSTDPLVPRGCPIAAHAESGRFHTFLVYLYDSRYTHAPLCPGGSRYTRDILLRPLQALVRGVDAGFPESTTSERSSGRNQAGTYTHRKGGPRSVTCRRASEKSPVLDDALSFPRCADDYRYLLLPWSVKARLVIRQAAGR